MAIERFPTTEHELAELLRTCKTVHCVLGTGALIWDTSKPMPEAVRQLGLMRGVMNENMDGAGI